LLPIAARRAKLNALILPADTRFTGCCDDFDCLHGEASVLPAVKNYLAWPGRAESRVCRDESARSNGKLVGRRIATFVLLCLLAALSLPGCCGVPGGRLRDWWCQHCKVGPNYSTPPAQIADDWIDANDPRLSRATTNYAYWWRVFNDPTLDSLIERASSQNLTLRAAGFRIMEARARRRIAVGALFPQFQQATADYQRFNISQRIANPPPIPDFNDFDVGFDLAWELDLWGRFRRAVEEQDARLDASIADYDDVLVILQAEVAATYVQMRGFEQRLIYATRNASSQRQVLDLASIREREGDVSSLDVLQSENIYRTTAASIPRFEAAVRQTRNALAVLLGVPPHDMAAELAADARIPTAPRDVVVGIPAELLRRRPDIRRAERNVAAQSARIGVAVSDLYPAVSIVGSLGWEAEHAGDLFTSESFRGNVGPSIRWNILHYGRIQANILAQDAIYQELVAQYEQTVLSANAEAEDAIIAFLKSQDELNEISQAASAAEKGLGIGLTQYREGAADYNRVLLVTDFLTSSQDQMAQTQANVALNLIRIYKALGGGWTTRLTPPNVNAAALPRIDDELPRQEPRQPAVNDMLLPALDELQPMNIDAR
jgi:NodT family efflux transporter outer membrane factor (OMF) lipoprotein